MRTRSSPAKPSALGYKLLLKERCARASGELCTSWAVIANPEEETRGGRGDAVELAAESLPALPCASLVVVTTVALHLRRARTYIQRTAVLP